MGAIRCFIAVFLDPAIRPRVEAFQQKLARSGAEVKWVEPQNLHFTLKFLGEVESGRLDGIARLLSGAVSGVRAFDLELGAVGAFPGMRNPRVVWIGLRAGGEALAALAARVEEAMKAEGFLQDGKGASPHLTIGRVRSGRNLHDLAREMASNPPPPGSMKAREVQLTSSDLGPRGPVYTPLHVIRLE